jgi:hypothetical protein
VTNSKKDQELGLAELLGSLGQELREANERATAKDVATLAWADAVVEVLLEVRTTAKGAIKFEVLGIGAEGGGDRGTGRTIRAQVRCVPAAENPVAGEVVGVPGGIVGILR